MKNLLYILFMCMLCLSCRTTKSATESTQQHTVQQSEKHASIFDQLQMFSALSFDSLIIEMKLGFERHWQTNGIQPDTAAQTQGFIASLENETVCTDSTEYNRHPPESYVSSLCRAETAKAGRYGTAEIKLYGLKQSARQTNFSSVEVQQTDSTAQSEIRYVIKQASPKYNLFLFGYTLGAVLSAFIAFLLWLLLRSNKSES